MKGTCKYCGKTLPDIANIRCDSCDRAWQEGRKSGIEQLKEETKKAISFLKSLFS